MMGRVPYPILDIKIGEGILNVATKPFSYLIKNFKMVEKHSLQIIIIYIDLINVMHIQGPIMINWGPWAKIN